MAGGRITVLRQKCFLKTFPSVGLAGKLRQGEWMQKNVCVGPVTYLSASSGG